MSVFDRFLAPTTPVNPRKVEKGTSYTATGLIEPPPELDNELGSSTPQQIRELVPVLASQAQRLATYSQMMNDAGVDVSIRAVKTPVLGAEFFMQSFSDSPEDQLVAEFCWSNLAEGMSSPLLNAMEDILHFYEDGYSVLNKVYEEREWAPAKAGANGKRYTMLKKLAVRPTSTISKIEYDDNGGPVSVVQQAIQADGKTKEVKIDINELLIFTFNRRAGDLTGRSLLRTAYPHWHYKTHFYKIDAIQKERHSLGVPKGKLLPGFNKNDKAILRQLLKNLRTNEEAFMVLTPNVDVEFAEIKGNLVNALDSASHHNTMILLNVMAQFMAMGVETGSGGRATAGAHVDMFMKALRYVANYIAEVINMYLIPELVVWNFPTRNFPKLQVRNIGETRDLQMLASAISNLLSQKGFEMDDPTEAWIRRVFDMPAKDASTTRQELPTSTADNGSDSNGQKGATKNGKQTGNVGKPANAPN